MYRTMSSIGTPADSNVDTGIARRIKEQYKSSISLKIATFGVGLYAFALLINFLYGMPPATEARTGLFDLWGLWAAIFTIWGGAMITLGLVTFSVVWLKRQ